MKLWITLFLFISFQHAYALNCENLAESELARLIESDHQGILKKQYTLTALKLAQISADKSLESYAKQFARSIPKNSKTITKLNELYKKYQMNTDYQTVLENLKSTLYWKKELRFYNQDISAFILLQKESMPSSKLNNTDAAIAWLAAKSSNSFNKGSRDKNSYNLSTHVAFINGVVKSKHSLSPKEITQRVTKLSKSIQKDLTRALNFFSSTFKSQCSHYFKQLCHNKDLLQQLFGKTIRNNIQNLSPPKIGRTLLKGELKKLLTQVKFKSTPPQVPKTKIFHVPVPDLPHYSKLNRYSNMEEFKQDVNGKSDDYLIHSYHKNVLPSKYGIISKKNSTLDVFNSNGELLTTVTLNLGDKTADQSPPGIGAGTFYLTSTYPDSTMNLVGERRNRSNIGLNHISAICETPSYCQSGQSKSFDLIYKYLTPKDPIYILPEEEGNTFLVKNGIINYTTLTPRQSYTGYNYSPRSNKCLPVNAYITEPSYNTPVARQFVSTLSQEKEKLMKMYHLDNDEYNDLMKLAFGILGNESQFGKSAKYHIKESLPFVVSLLKGNGLDTSRNSRGPTQIKRVPEDIAKEYGVTKTNLNNPKKAAVATLGFLAEALQELKSKEKIARSKGITINALNRMDYVHYIYMGRSTEITQGTATPEKNIYLRQVKQFSKDLVLLQSSS